ncbi:MAG: hypothetical protein VKJ06_07825 [Vampirovibrionales bacterium]|nr:hypothetical protein [Vampirovibrionales bacterium]
MYQAFYQIAQPAADIRLPHAQDAAPVTAYAYVRGVNAAPVSRQKPRLRPARWYDASPRMTQAIALLMLSPRGLAHQAVAQVLRDLYGGKGVTRHEASRGRAKVGFQRCDDLLPELSLLLNTLKHAPVTVQAIAANKLLWYLSHYAAQGADANMIAAGATDDADDADDALSPLSPGARRKLSK